MFKINNTNDNNDMKTTRNYAPPRVEIFGIIAEQGFAQSKNIFTTTTDDYDIVDEIRWE